MAKVKNTFIKSKMNKDLDARIIANNEYRNALNVQVSKSEGENVGSLENVLGNNLIANVAVHTGVSGLYCIGHVEDDSNGNMYLFFTNYLDQDPTQLKYNSSAENFILKCSSSGVLTTLVKGAFLNFSKTHLIYGINIVENLLFWTDNRNQPRKINIDLANPTKLAIPTYYTTEDQISVAKYNPYSAIELYAESKESTAPTTQYETTMKDVTSKFYPNGGSSKLNAQALSGAASFVVKNLKGYIAQAQIPNPYDSGANVSYIDALGNIVPIPSAYVDTVVYSAPAGVNPALWTVNILGATIPTTLAADTEIIFNYNKYYEKDFAGDDTYLEDKFVRFAYRFKFVDDEYSLFSTFTQSTFIPRQDGYFMYVKDDARGMPELDDQAESYRSTIVSFVENKVDKIQLRIPLPFKNYELKDKLLLESIDILYRESDQTTVKVVDTIEEQEIFNQSANCTVRTTTTSSNTVLVDNVKGGINVGSYVTGFGITTNITVTAYQPDNPNINPSTSGEITLSSPVSLAANVELTIGEPEYFTYDYQSQKPFKTLPEKDLIRVYDKIPVRALAQEVSGNRVIYGNFLNKHTAPDFIDYQTAITTKSAFNTLEAQGDAVGPIPIGSTQIELINIKDVISVGMVVICDGVPEGTLVTGVNATTIEIDTPTTAVIANLQLVLLVPGSDIQKTTSKIEYPNSSVKTNRNYQIGVVLSDRYGRQSGTILSNNKTSITLPNGASFKGDTAYSPYNDENIDNDSWPGNSIKVLFNNVIGEQKDAQLALPGVYNGDPTSADYNPLGWYSFKVVVKQTEQDYYNVYLPGIMASYPSDQSLEVGETSHTVLISDNINKVPRDLVEVGPQQDQFRASVRLYGRVQNSATSVSVGSTNLGLSNEQYYPGRTSDFASTVSTVRDLFDYDPQVPPQPNFFPQFYSLDSNPYIARINTANKIGQLSNVNFSAVSGTVSISGTSSTIRLNNVSGTTGTILPGDTVQGPGFPSDLTLVSFTGTTAGPAGVIMAGAYTGTSITVAPGGGAIGGITVGMMITAASGTPTIPAGTIVLNKDATTAAPNVILELNNPVNIGAADTLNFTTPAQIVVSEAVDASVGDLVNIYSAATPGIQYLAVYETEPVESLLDIFWETSTTGLVKSVNDIVLNENTGGLGAAGLNQWNDSPFLESLTFDFGGTKPSILTAPIYLVDNFDVQIPNSEIDEVLSLDSVVDGYGTNVQIAYDQGPCFAFTETGTNTNQFNVTIDTGFIGGYTFGQTNSVWFGTDPLLRTFTFTFSAVVNGLPFNQSFTSTLGNVAPHIPTGIGASMKVLIPETTTIIKVYDASDTSNTINVGDTVEGVGIPLNTIATGTTFSPPGGSSQTLPLVNTVYQSTTSEHYAWENSLLVVGYELVAFTFQYQSPTGPLYTPPGTYLVSKTTLSNGNIECTWNKAISFLSGNGGGIQIRPPATLEVNNSSTVTNGTLLEALDSVLWDNCPIPTIYPLELAVGENQGVQPTEIRDLGLLKAVNGAGWRNNSVLSGNSNSYKDLTFEITGQRNSLGNEVDHFALDQANQSFNLARQATIPLINQDYQTPNVATDVYTIDYRVSDPTDFVDCSVLVNMGINISKVQQWRLDVYYSSNCTPGGNTGVTDSFRVITLFMSRPGGTFVGGDGSNGYYAYIANSNGAGQFPSWSHLISNSSANNIVISDAESTFSAQNCGWRGPSLSLTDTLNPGSWVFYGLLTTIAAGGGNPEDGLCGDGCFVQGGPDQFSWTLEAGFGTTVPIEPSPTNYAFSYQE